LGVGVYLFFKNYAFNALIFTLMFLTYSIYALITNIQSFNDSNGTSGICLLSGCGLSPIGAGSKLLQQTDTKNRYSFIQSWIGVGFVALWGIFYAAKTFMEDKFVIKM